LNFKVSHGNFLTLTPPLTVTRSELDQAMDILNAALTEVEIEARKDYVICMKGDSHG
jgi:4-aminobutyrate aminotransferase